MVPGRMIPARHGLRPSCPHIRVIQLHDRIQINPRDIPLRVRLKDPLTLLHILFSQGDLPKVFLSNPHRSSLR